MAAASALFDAIVASPSGVVFAVDEWAGVRAKIATPDRKLHPAMPEMLAALATLADAAPAVDPAFPLVLAAGERRSFTANTIIRDPAWRKKDAGGALRIHPDDAAALGLADGARARLVTRQAASEVDLEVSDAMRPGSIALPNGLGLDYPTADGARLTGVALNELTATADRDPFVGTPWHKHVPARLERL